jgi:hypothetical protein
MYRNPPSKIGEDIIGPNSTVQYSNGFIKGFVFTDPVLFAFPLNIVQDSLDSVNISYTC